MEVRGDGAVVVRQGIWIYTEDNGEPWSYKQEKDTMIRA